MGSIVTTLGAGSGIDMGKLAADLSTAQFKSRLDRLAARTAQYTQRISTASSIRNALGALATSLGERVRSGDLAATAQVAAPAVASASFAGGARPAGSYSLEVTELAKGQVLTSAALAAPTTPVGAGTLTIRFGTVGTGSFAADPAHAPLEIAVPEGATLAVVARSINDARGGVSAYVANTAAGAQLVIKGAEGAANGFVVETAEMVAGNGLSALGWEPAAGDPARLTASAGDAAFKLDGLAMTSASNRTTEVAPGLTLQLTGTNAGAPTAISFSSPTATVPGLMQDLVSALNEVATQLRDATKPPAGDLVSDPGARALKNALARLSGDTVMPGAPVGSARTLGDLGLKLERDGTFTLDSARLDRTLARDPAGVAAMMTNGLNGVFGTIDRLARRTTLASDPGSLAGSIARHTKLSSAAGAQSSEIAGKQEVLRQQMVQRFAKADTNVAASQSTLTFLKAQIDAWNASRNG